MVEKEQNEVHKETARGLYAESRVQTYLLRKGRPDHRRGQAGTWRTRCLGVIGGSRLLCGPPGPEAGPQLTPPSGPARGASLRPRRSPAPGVPSLRVGARPHSPISSAHLPTTKYWAYCSPPPLQQFSKAQRSPEWSLPHRPVLTTPKHRPIMKWAFLLSKLQSTSSKTICL